MKFMHRKYSTSLAVTWFLSYMAVLLVPMCVFAFFSFHSMSVLNTEIEFFNSLSTQYIQRYVDSVVQESNSISEMLNMSPEVTKILQYSSRNQIPVLDLYSAQEKMRKTRSYVQGIEEIYLFCPDFDTVIGNTSYASSKSYFDSYLSDTSLSYEQWLSLISTPQPSVRLTGFSRNLYDNNGEKILLVRPLTAITHGKHSASLIMEFDRSMMLEVNERQFHSLIIIDTYRRNLVYNSTNFNFDFSMLPEYCFTLGSFTKQLEQKNMDFMIAGVDSEVLNWKYLALEDRSVYFSQTRFLQRSMIIWFSVCFVFGLLVIILFTRHSYKPVNDVVKTIDDKHDGARHGNEIQYIQSAIEKMKEDKKNIISSQMIANLVQKSDNKKIPSRTELAKYGIVFQSNLFAVMVYKVDSSENSEAYRNRIRTIINKAFKDEQILIYFFDVEEYIGAILSIGDIDVEKESGGLYERMGICIETMCRLENTHVPAACSNIVFTYFDLYTAFTQAVDTLYYSTLYPNAYIRFYKDMISYSRGRNFEYPVETEVEIIDELKKGNEKAVMNSIDQVIQHNIDAKITPKSARFLLLNISGTIIKVFSRLDEKSLSLYPDISMRPVLRDSTFAIFREDIQIIVHKICDILKHNDAFIQNKEEFALYTAVLTYIGQQYQNVNLSLDLIADEVNYSSVSLSRLFKKYNGEYISDYINSVRIGYAKKLLVNGMNLGEIASRCGFGSLRTFMRVFKKMEAMTPGQYASMTGGK